MKKETRVRNRAWAAILLVMAMMLGVLQTGVLVYAHDARVVDQAGLLDESEAASLTEKLDELSEEYETDVVIVTVNSLEGKTPTEYADDYFDYHDYGYGDNNDGILFLLAMDERKWAISTTGYGIEAFTDAGQEYMQEQFLPYLKDGEYAEAFETFASLCRDFLKESVDGKPYDTNHMPKKPLRPGTILTGIAIGAAVAWLVVAGMKRQLKSIRPQRGAVNYIKDGSFDLERRDDVFLYDRVTRVKKPKQESSGGSSVHTGSSGTSHGGSSGSF